jgi:ATP-dependent Lon protease
MSGKYNLRNKKSSSKKEKEKENEKSAKHQKLRKNQPDDNIDDDDDNNDESDYDSEYETEYETENSDDENEENDDDDDDTASNDDTDDTDEDADEDEEIKKNKQKNKKFNNDEFKELLSCIFPSKYAKKALKSKKTENEKEDCTNLVKKALDYSKKQNKNESTPNEDKLINEILNHMKEKKQNKTKKSKNQASKNENSSEDDSEDCSNDENTSKKNKNNHYDGVEDETDEDYDPKQQKTKKTSSTPSSNDNIFMTITYDDEYDEENIDEILNNENEEIDSEDEKTFMSDVYEKIDESSLIIKSKDKKENKKILKENKKTLKKNEEKSSKNKKSSNDDTSEILTSEKIEEEYKKLVTLKKQLSEKLEKNPNSKILINAIKECNKEIKQLIIKNRRNNTKEYYNLSNNEPKHTGELEYFKTKLSNKEQIKIMEDLRAINEHIQVVKPYRLTLLQSNIPAKYKATVMQKLNMLQTMEPGDSEYHKLKTWIDAFMRIPFNVYKDLSISINDGVDTCNNFMNNAKKTLDECTYGLDDAKMQILQLVGQWITNPKAMGTAIAIYGPKGTGKTSLSKDGISKIFGREFSFISLGGSGDSSFLEGHSYTYEGSTWGKIAQILIESKCMNPIIYFDELDKISDTPRGQEITGILTHLTDTTQNNQFKDKYFNEIDFDLSRCLFIFSYNDESAVNPILRDRMYRIQTKGYDIKEKTIIAKKYLLPKIREQVNFNEGDIVIPDDVIQYIISNEKLTQKEEGVRNLKRCLEIIHTKLNLFRLMHNTGENSILGKNIQLNVQFPYTITRADVDVLIKNEEKQNQSLLAMYV